MGEWVVADAQFWIMTIPLKSIRKFRVHFFTALPLPG